MALETVYETIIQWDEGGGKRSRRELARRVVSLYTHLQNPQRSEDINLSCKSTQARLAASWGYVKAQPEQEPMAAIQHWCTYCQGYNAHNCQFNTQLPRVHTYATNHTTPPQRTWVGLTADELSMIGDRMRTWNSHSLTDVYFAIETKLKEKNNA